MALFTTHYTEVVGISTVTVLFRYTVKKTRMRIYKYFFQFIYFLLLILLILLILLLLLALLLLLLLLLLHDRIKNEGDFMSQDEIPKNLL